MAKIIYKKGKEGQNSLSSIEGIEIELLNGQKALIYPKYALRKMLLTEQISKWNAANESEFEALKVKDTKDRTDELLKIGSPAAEWTAQFLSDEHGRFNLSSLLSAMEIQNQKKEIDALAETIEGADLLRDFTSSVWSCSRTSLNGGWFVSGGYVYAGSSGSNGKGLGAACLAVPTMLYREEEI